MDMTEQEFLEQQGPYFHINLLMLYNESVPPEEWVEDHQPVAFNFQEGEYVIKLGDLKEKADSETLIFLEKNQLDLNQGPILSNQARVTRKK